MLQFVERRTVERIIELLQRLENKHFFSSISLTNQKTKKPSESTTEEAKRRIRFAPVVKVRYVNRLEQPFAGWGERKMINKKLTYCETIGWGLSNEFFDSTLDFEEQANSQEARSLSDHWMKTYSSHKTHGSVIEVEWMQTTVKRFAIEGRDQNVTIRRNHRTSSSKRASTSLQMDPKEANVATVENNNSLGAIVSDVPKLEIHRPSSSSSRVIDLLPDLNNDESAALSSPPSFSPVKPLKKLPSSLPKRDPRFYDSLFMKLSNLGSMVKKYNIILNSVG